MFSSQSPSPRYQQLLGYYTLMHNSGVSRRQENDVVHIKPERTFEGRGVFKHARTIGKLCWSTDARSILDYGSGKGRQYVDEVHQKNKKVAENLQEYWKVNSITCFDPAISTDQEIPDRRFDGVISTNVLDLIPEEDLPWVVDTLFERANKFVFCNVMSFPSDLFLPNGENSRVTRRSSIWWRGIFEEANKKHPDVRYCIAFGSKRRNKAGDLVDRFGYLHNCDDMELLQKP